LWDLDGAITRLLKAIDILATLSSSERQRMLQLYERIGELSLKNFDLDRGATRMKRALEIAEGLKADKYIARFSLLRGKLLVAASRIDEGRRWLDQARYVAGSVTDTDLSREILLATASADSHIGEYEKAVKAIREAMTFARESGNLEAEINCFIPLALTYSFMQDYNSALDTLAQAISRVEGVSDSMTSCRIYQLESQINHLARNEHAAIRAANMAMELAKDAGLTYQCAISAFRIGNSYLYLQDYTRAFTSLRYSYELATEHGFVRLQMSDLKLLGFIDAVRFQSEEGLARLIEAVDYAKSKNDLINIIHGEILLAIVEQGRGQLQAALDVLREARKLASERGSRRFIEYVEQALRSATNGQPIQIPL
jgi:eukaryotic-like serine/threonine-protein kinase